MILSNILLQQVALVSGYASLKKWDITRINIIQQILNALKERCNCIQNDYIDKYKSAQKSIIHEINKFSNIL